MTSDLKHMTIADFKDQGSAQYRIETDAGAVDLTLIETTELGAGERPGGAFSLLFAGPREPLLDQGIYRLARSDQDELELFLVPVNQTDDASHYEAIFT